MPRNNNLPYDIPDERAITELASQASRDLPSREELARSGFGTPAERVAAAREQIAAENAQRALRAEHLGASIVPTPNFESVNGSQVEQPQSPMAPPPEMVQKNPQNLRPLIGSQGQ